MLEKNKGGRPAKDNRKKNRTFRISDETNDYLRILAIENDSTPTAMLERAVEALYLKERT